VPPVTRSEIARHTAAAFDHPPVTPGDLVEAVIASRGRPEVIAVLRRLPDGRYTHLRQLWPHLPEVPVHA
jgi:hypothetical protein